MIRHELARIKGEADAYGVAVRAGAITPQTDDEAQFRARLSLPAMSADAQKAWEKDEGTRRPITLTPPPGTDPTSPFSAANNEPSNNEDEDDDDDAE